MSIKALTWSKEQPVGSLSRFAVFMLLADQARDCGHVWVSVKTLATYCRVDPRNIREHIKNLIIKDGVMSSMPNFRADGTQTSNLYFLPLTNKLECDEDCRGYDLGILGSGEIIKVVKNHPGHPDVNHTPPLTNTSGQGTFNTNPHKKGNTWEAPPGYEWATQLSELKHVHKTHPATAWLDKRAADRSIEWLTNQVEMFVDYYNAPGVSLVSWKSAFTGWLNRGAKRDPDAASAVTGGAMTHDPAKPRGGCGCGWCKAFNKKKAKSS